MTPRLRDGLASGSSLCCWPLASKVGGECICIINYADKDCVVFGVCLCVCVCVTRTHRAFSMSFEHIKPMRAAKNKLVSSGYFIASLYTQFWPCADVTIDTQQSRQRDREPSRIVELARHLAISLTAHNTTPNVCDTPKRSS